METRKTVNEGALASPGLRPAPEPDPETLAEASRQQALRFQHTAALLLLIVECCPPLSWPSGTKRGPSAAEAAASHFHVHNKNTHSQPKQFENAMNLLEVED